MRHKFLTIVAVVLACGEKPHRSLSQSSRETSFVELPEYHDLSASPIQLLRFLGNDRYLLVGNSANEVCMFDLEIRERKWGNCGQRVPPARYAPPGMSFSGFFTADSTSDEKWIAAGGVRDAVDLIYAATGRIERRFTIADGRDLVAQVLRFSGDDRVLAVASAGQKIHLFDVQSGRRTATLQPALEITKQLVFSDDGSMLLEVGAEGLQIWNPITQQFIQRIGVSELGLTGSIRVARLTKDWRYAAVVDNSGKVHIISLEKRSKIRTFSPRTWPERLHFSPDQSQIWVMGSAGFVEAWEIVSNMLIVATSSGAALGSQPFHLQIIDANTDFSATSGLFASPNHSVQRQSYGVRLSRLFD